MNKEPVSTFRTVSSAQLGRFLQWILSACFSSLLHHLMTLTQMLLLPRLDFDLMKFCWLMMLRLILWQNLELCLLLKGFSYSIS